MNEPARHRRGIQRPHRPVPPWLTIASEVFIIALGAFIVAVGVGIIAIGFADLLGLIEWTLP